MGLGVETLDSAGLWLVCSRLDRSVTSMAGRLTGTEKGETGTEPFLLGKAVPTLYVSSAVRWPDWEEGRVDVDLTPLWSLEDALDEWMRLSLSLSLLELRKMFLKDDIRSHLHRAENGTSSHEGEEKKQR